MLAAQGKELGYVALTMFSFGIGSAVPLVLLGLLSRESFMRGRGKMLSFGRSRKIALGGLLTMSGLLILLVQIKHLKDGSFKFFPNPL